MAPIRVLYGVTINDTIKRGDPNEMKALLKEAKATHKAQGDLAKAIARLEIAVKRPKVDPRPLYGVPINDALKRGNKAELTALLAQAKATHRTQRDLKKAIKDLETAIKSR